MELEQLSKAFSWEYRCKLNHWSDGDNESLKLRRWLKNLFQKEVHLLFYLPVILLSDEFPQVISHVFNITCYSINTNMFPSREKLSSIGLFQFLLLTNFVSDVFLRFSLSTINENCWFSTRELDSMNSKIKCDENEPYFTFILWNLDFW